MDALFVGSALFAWAMWAVLFWGSIYVFDRYNAQNKFGYAVALSLLHLIVALTVQYMFFAGVFFAVGWLTFMLWLLLMSYQIGPIKGLAVLATSNVLPYYLLPWLARFVGDSETEAWTVLYGFPVVVAVVWLRPDRWLRNRAEKKAEAKPERAELPVARVERQPRPAKPSAPQPVASVAPAAVAATPPSETPRLLT